LKNNNKNYCPLFENAAVTKFTTRLIEKKQFFISNSINENECGGSRKMLSKNKIFYYQQNLDDVIAKFLYFFE